MSATEELIASEAGKLSIDEKKPSIAESDASSSSSSSSTSSSASSSSHQHCHCSFMKQNPCMASSCSFPPCMMPSWGPIFIIPPWHPGICHPHKCSKPKSEKKSKKCKKEAEDEKPAEAPSEEKVCECCKAGKCECCKSGKECGKDDDAKSDKDEKSDGGSGDEGEGDGDGDGDGDDETNGCSHSVTKLVRYYDSFYSDE